MVRALRHGAALSLACMSCSVLSGTSELSGGPCATCVDASVDAPAQHATPIACGAQRCDTNHAWCCTASAGATSCADPCPTGAAALGCIVPSDCPQGRTCCYFHSTFPRETEDRVFTDCLATCDPATDKVVCDVRVGCANGTCSASEVAAITICR